jgi:hypothetical protein
MVWGVRIPASSPNFRAQRSASDCTDEFFQFLFRAPSFVPIHRAFQFAAFVVFLGVLKAFLGLVTFVVLAVAVAVLPLFKGLFATPAGFKRWAYSILRHLVRVFLLSVGVVGITIEGGPGERSRVLASNSVCLLDYLVHFYAAPITFVTDLNVPGLLLGSALDVFRFDLRPRKGRRQSPKYQIRDCALDPGYDPLLLFPEGAATNGAAVVRFANEFFRKCAHNRYDVQPVAIQYCIALTPAGFNTLAGHSVFALLPRILAAPWISVTISYLAAETPKTGDKDGTVYADNCQLAVANRLGTRAVTRGVAPEARKCW